MFLQESAVWLLCHLKCLETLSIDELDISPDGTVLRFCLVWNVLDRRKVDLKRVQLLAIELAEEWLVRLDPEAEVVQCIRLQAIKSVGDL